MKKLLEHRGYRYTWLQESQQRDVWRALVKHLLDEGKGAGAGVQLQALEVQSE